VFEVEYLNILFASFNFMGYIVKKALQPLGWREFAAGGTEALGTHQPLFGW
jgi:hypothetical protein